MSDDSASSIKVAIDLSYDQLMTEKVTLSLQTYCLSLINFRILRCCLSSVKDVIQRTGKLRNQYRLVCFNIVCILALFLLQFYLTSFGGKCEKQMDELVSGYKSWNVCSVLCSFPVTSRIKMSILKI